MAEIWNKNFKIDKSYERKFEELVKGFDKAYGGKVEISDSFVFRQLIDHGERVLEHAKPG